MRVGECRSVVLAETGGHRMGKKSKRHTASAGAAKSAAGSLINNKTVCKLVDDLWDKTQGTSTNNLGNLWKEYDEIMAVIGALREKQGASPRPLPPREEGFAAFYDWLKANKAEFDNVEIGSFGGVGYGIKAKANIAARDMVMRIPERLMMTSETAKASQLGPMILRDRMLQMMPNVALAIHLLNERYNPSSFWKPYIEILPHSFSLPLSFSRSHLELLQGSPCLSDAIQHVRSVGKLYSHLHKLIRAHGDTSFHIYTGGFYYDDFVWAVSAVMSRQNEIPQKDVKLSQLALIPLWDMCNHWMGTISTDFNTELRCCDCFSPSAVKAGKELRIFYGARSNAELFLHQGFVYPPNTGDSLRIKMGLSSGEDSATKAMKSKLLTRLGIPLSGVFHLLAAEEPFSSQLKAFVRVFTAKTDDLKRYVSMERDVLGSELMAEQWGPGDLAALQFLIQRCELLLKTYRSSVFDDFERVTRTKLDERTHQILMLTICERCILSSAVKMATAHKAVLERGEDKTKDEVRKKSTVEEGETPNREEKDTQMAKNGPEQRANGGSLSATCIRESLVVPNKEGGDGGEEGAKGRGEEGEGGREEEEGERGMGKENAEGGRGEEEGEGGRDEEGWERAGQDKGEGTGDKEGEDRTERVGEMREEKGDRKEVGYEEKEEEESTKGRETPSEDTPQETCSANGLNEHVDIVENG